MPLSAVPSTDLPDASNQVVLCHDAKKTIAWLELKNFEYLLNQSPSQNVCRILVGAVSKNGTWQTIDVSTANGNRAVSKVLSDGMVFERVQKFQARIIREWQGFSHARAADFAKGTSFGKSLTSASFVIKALKTGFEEIGVTGDAYSGLRIKNWTVDEITGYFDKMKALADAQSGTPTARHVGFSPYIPHPLYASRERLNSGMHADHYQGIELIPSITPLPRVLPYQDYFATGGGSGLTFKTKKGNVKVADLPRVAAYGFRGDDRFPWQVRTSGGFHPNTTRPDHTPYQQPLDLNRHISDYHGMGFVSVSKSMFTAKGFAQTGYVYVIDCVGAFDTGTSEHEIALAGGADWENVVAYRMCQGGRLTGPIWFKDGFPARAGDAYRALYKVLSGEPQGNAP